MAGLVKIVALTLFVNFSIFATPAAAAPALDTTFGGGVITPKVFPKGKWSQVARSAVIQADGKVLVPMALSVKYGRRSERPVLRYNRNGSLDRSYGKNGAAWFGVRGEKYVGLSGVSLQRDGKALVFGGTADTRLGLGAYFVARLTRSGRLDKSFGRDGVTRLSDGTTRSRYPIGTYPLEDGKTIVAFQQLQENDDSLDLVRLKKNGRVDRSYADRGVKSIEVARGHPFADIADIVIAGDEAFVLVNPDEDTTRYPCKLIRTKISSSGGRVKSFGRNGTVTIAASDAKDVVNCRSVTPTSDGGVAVAGSVLFNNFDGTSAGVAYRFHTDGSRNQAFGVGGKVQGPDQDDFGGIAELPAGGFLLAGTRTNFEDPSQGPVGGIISTVDTSGGLLGLLEGSLVPGTARFTVAQLSHGVSGNVLRYARFSEKGEIGSRIAKFTN